MPLFSEQDNPASFSPHLLTRSVSLYTYSTKTYKKTHAYTFGSTILVVFLAFFGVNNHKNAAHEIMLKSTDNFKTGMATYQTYSPSLTQTEMSQ